MGSYIDNNDLYDRFGVNNITEWADLEGSGASQADRLTAAIAFGEEWVNSRFRGSQYATPLSPSGNGAEIVKKWMATVAGIWLYESRGRDRGESDKLGEMEDLRTATEEEIGRVLTGQIELDAAASYDDGPTAPVVFE